MLHSKPASREDSLCNLTSENSSLELADAVESAGCHVSEIEGQQAIASSTEGFPVVAEATVSEAPTPLKLATLSKVSEGKVSLEIELPHFQKY